MADTNRTLLGRLRRFATEDRPGVEGRARNALGMGLAFVLLGVLMVVVGDTESSLDEAILSAGVLITVGAAALVAIAIRNR